MTAAVLIVIGGLLVIALLLTARAFEARWWRSHLQPYELTFPHDIDDDMLAAWLSAVAAVTHRPRWSVLPMPPVGWEVVASASGIQHFLLVSANNRDAVLSALRATIPGARLDPAPDYLENRPPMTVAAEARLTSHARPLALQRSVGTSSSFLASLQPLSAGTTIVLQWLVTSAGTANPVKQATAGVDTAKRIAWLVDDETPVDAEAVRQQRLKQQEPLLHAVVRLGVSASSTAAATKHFGHSWSHLQGMNAPGVRLVRRWLPSATVRSRLDRLALPLISWPVLLNTREAAGLSGLPVSDQHLPGLSLTGSRQLPPPNAMPRAGCVIAISNYPGMEDRPLALSTTDRLRHIWACSPTGSGKSWLLAAMILQDIAAGRGVVVIDVKGDLIPDIAERVRPQDEDRVIVLDADRRDRPVGLNVLSYRGGESERELVVDNVLHTFREIWHGSWGPRTDYYLRNALATLVQGKGADDSRLTICEIVPLLTQAAFRRSVLDRASLNDELRAFWQRYEALSANEQANSLGPIINKVTAFTGRSATRLMLGQSDGIDLADVFRERKAVLISLPKGKLGIETANLSAALCVATLWQATLRRVAVPSDHRAPAFAYIDEAQDVVRLPVSMADMLAEARGLGLGMVLANQFAKQLPESVLTSMFGTVRTHIVFQLDHDDARVMERRFAPLTAGDLTALPQWEIAMRPCVDGQTRPPVTGKTLPLGPPTRQRDEVAALSRERYGRPRAEVEAALTRRSAVKPRAQGFGREVLESSE